MPKRDEEVEKFFETHQAGLLSFVRQMGLGLHEAEDIINDCFAVIWLRWDRLRDGNPVAYLYKVARNEVYTRADRQRRRPEDLLEDPPAVTVEDFAQQVADHQALRGALSTLSGREREAVLLRYYAGCNVAEAADAMGGIKPGAVQRYAFDGIRKLRRALINRPGDTRKAGTR